MSATALTATVLAYVPREDVGMIVTAYLTVATAGALLVWRVVRRGRQLTRRVPREDWPWT
jgi:hypothetical protein